MNIIPTFTCNFRCPFCFNQDRWNDHKIMDLDKLRNTLNSIEHIYDISIIGGEPTVLPKDYLKKLIDICRERLGNRKPTLHTNLFSGIFVFFDLVDLKISYDPMDRQRQGRVLNNMIKQPGEYEIYMCVTKRLINNYSIAGLEKLSRKLHHRIHLEILDKVENVDMSKLMPTAKEIREFVKDIYKSDCYIAFSPINYIRDICIKKTYTPIDFDNDVSLTPDWKYQINASHNECKKYYDTYEEAYQAFLNKHKEANVCKMCEFRSNCLDIYRVGENCTTDYEIMSELKELKDKL